MRCALKTELTDKQRRFAEEYAKDLNGTRAAVAAGYSEKSAPSQASRMLKNDKVKAEIAKLLDKATQNAEVTLDFIMHELKVIATATMADFATWTGNRVNLKTSDELSPEQLKAVESVGVTSGKDGKPQTRIRLHSKLRVLEGLLRVFEIKEIDARLNAIEEKLK